MAHVKVLMKKFKFLHSLGFKNCSFGHGKQFGVPQIYI